jgi:small subunit ribosomal protein S16
VVVIDNDRAAYWLSVGAQPSDAVRKLLEISGALAARAVEDDKIHVVGEEAQIQAAAEEAAAAETAEQVEGAVAEVEGAVAEVEGAVAEVEGAVAEVEESVEAGTDEPDDEKGK